MRSNLIKRIETLHKQLCKQLKVQFKIVDNLDNFRKEIEEAKGDDKQLLILYVV